MLTRTGAGFDDSTDSVSGNEPLPDVVARARDWSSVKPTGDHDSTPGMGSWICGALMTRVSRV